MELRKNYRKLTTALSRFWHREAGPMNWKNPVRVTAYMEHPTANDEAAKDRLMKGLHASPVPDSGPHPPCLPDHPGGRSIST